MRIWPIQESGKRSLTKIIVNALSSYFQLTLHFDRLVILESASALTKQRLHYHPTTLYPNMKELTIKTNPDVEEVFDKYPAKAREKIRGLRRLIIEAAGEVDGIPDIEETLRWGEPSYVVKKGSTIRIDWKEKAPDQYAMYFKCTSRLVPTFKMVFGDRFRYEGTRAIVFQMNDELPEAELKKCITAALTYHRVKHLPLLGF